MILFTFNFFNFEVSAHYSMPWQWGNPLRWIFDISNHTDYGGGAANWIITIIVIFGLQIGVIYTGQTNGT